MPKPGHGHRPELTALPNSIRSSVGKQWTDSGENPRRPRPQEPARGRGPACADPHLVTILRNHIDTFGVAGDGRLFTNRRRGVVGSATYYRVWPEARAPALPPAAVASPLAARPYDLRHSALSTWLNSGVDATEVAERAGHSVEVLLSRYAKCIDGRQEIANRKIEELLAEYD